MNHDELDHPITLHPEHGTVVVAVDGREIARTDRAVVLREKGYDPVHYVPRGDVRMDLLTRSDKRTRCPFKGEASYYELDGREVAWSYEDPRPGVGGISGHLAFDRKVAEVGPAG